MRCTSSSVLLLAVAIACAPFGMACGGDPDPVCGNGVQEDGEGCDDGNVLDGDGCSSTCRSVTIQTDDVVIKWAFNKGAADQFEADGCFDLGASKVVVELEGPGEPLMAEESCGFRQVTFIDVPGGVYTARLHVTTSDGTLLTNAPVEDSFTVTPGQDIEREVVIGFDQWARDYTGTFYFRLVWGGSDCDLAAPPVAEHNLRLEVQGSVVSQVTDVGDRVDGTTPAPCRGLAEQFPQSVLMVPWGPAQFTVVGRDSAGEVQFQETFDTFVGAGVNNPEMEFDVNSVQPDAGVPDAGVPDAGV